MADAQPNREPEGAPERPARAVAKAIAARNIVDELITDIANRHGHLGQGVNPQRVAESWRAVICRHLNFYDERA